MSKPDLATHVEAVLTLVGDRFDGTSRVIIAIAGPPGAGKSTLAEAATNAAQARFGSAALVPMDGYHLDNRILNDRGLLARKGAPETFDAAGFATMLGRLRAAEGEVVIPVFDRDRDLAIAGASIVSADCPILFVEGNYLLLDDPAWIGCRNHFDATVMLSPTLDILEERLIDRWIGHGLSDEEAVARARQNDIPNAHRVVTGSVAADLSL